MKGERLTDGVHGAADDLDCDVRLLHVATVPMSFLFLRGQVTFMRQQGIAVFAISSPGPGHEEMRSEGVRTWEVTMERRISPLRDLRAVAQLLRHMRSLRPHIVHTHTPKGGLLGMIAACIARAPVRVYHLRGLPISEARGVKRVLLWLSDFTACRLANRVIAVSHSLRAEALALRLVSPHKIVVLNYGSGNGVDARGRFDPAQLDAGARAEARQRCGIPPASPVVGFIGRLVRDKGITELAAAWRALREQFPTAHMILVGPFEAQDPVLPSVRSSLESDPRVHLVGPQSDTRPFVLAMDVVVLPTYREGLPNVLLEAAALERPVVASDVSGCIDAVVPGQTGFLVPPKQVAPLVDAVGQYLRCPELRRSHGLAAREHVLTQFNPIDIWRRLAEEYARLLSQAAPHSAHGTVAVRDARCRSN